MMNAAREQLDQAAALFRDMEMTWWSEQAEGLRVRIDGSERCGSDVLMRFRCNQWRRR